MAYVGQVLLSGITGSNREVKVVFDLRNKLALKCPMLAARKSASAERKNLFLGLIPRHAQEFLTRNVCRSLNLAASLVYECVQFHRRPHEAMQWNKVDAFRNRIFILTVASCRRTGIEVWSSGRTQLFMFSTFLFWWFLASLYWGSQPQGQSVHLSVPSHLTGAWRKKNIPPPPIFFL